MSLKSCFTLLGLALCLALSLPAQTVRVLLVKGMADITPAGETVARPIVKGEAVTIGATITTGPDGRVVLTPMPGVKSIITPNTTITLESASEARGTGTTVAYQATLDLKVGAVVSDLDKPEDVTYDYSVRTPRGLAGARGTTFTVGVNPAGIATVVVAHGTITLTFVDGRTASITPGKVSITKPDGTVVEAEKISDLSPEDQAIASNWTEITLEAITEAVADGADISPETLQDVQDTATGLGLELSAESQSLLQTLQETLGGADTTQKNTEANDVITRQTDGDGHTPLPIDSLALFRAALTPGQLAAFDKLSSVNQGLLVSINDTVITNLVLAGDNITGAAFTDLDLRLNLTAIAQLSPAGLAFLKDANDASFEFGPGPAEWSRAAFDRSAASWNALSDADRNLLLTFRATEAVMDRSAIFLSAFIQKVRDLPPSARDAIIDTGWGFLFFEEYFRDSFYTEQAVTLATQLNATQRAIIRYFELDPFDVIFADLNIQDRLSALAGLSESQRFQLRSLDLGSDLLYLNNTTLLTIIDRVAALTATRREAVLELGLGRHFGYTSGETIQLDNGDTTTIANRLNSLVTAYLGLSITRREALRDSRVFDSYYRNSILSELVDPANLSQLADTFLALPARTRAVIARSHDYSLLDLLDQQSESSYRNLSQFATLVAGLSDAELETLRDIEGDQILFTALVFDNDPLTKIKSAIAFYNGLTIQQKFVLRELGILQQYELDWLTVNKQGLARLLGSYAQLPGTLLAGTNFVEFGTSSGSTINGASVFLTNSSYTFFDVSFVSPGTQLHIGAVKDLVIQGENFGAELHTFETAANGSLFLRASDLIDLDYVSFGAGIRRITMEAATINLANLNFPNQTSIALNSRLGGSPNFGSSVSGRVNFIQNVFYANNPLFDQQSFNDFGKNIKIGTLANPVTPGAYQTVPDGMNLNIPQ